MNLKNAVFTTKQCGASELLESEYVMKNPTDYKVINKSSDEVIIDGKSKIIKGALLAYIIFIFGTIIYTTLIFPVDLNITASVVLIGCIIIAFIIGQTLRIMLHSVFTLVKILFYLMQIICIWALQIISQILYLIINGFRNMMEIFSYPSLVLYKLIFK